MKFLLGVFAFLIIATITQFGHLGLISDFTYLVSIFSEKAHAEETETAKQHDYCQIALAYPEQVKNLPSIQALKDYCHD